MTTAEPPPLNFASRIDFTALLKTLTPLHVGSGQSRKDGRLPVEAEGAAGAEAEVSEIVLDGAGMPYIPGSTLKGALRGRLEAALKRLDREPSDANELFGSSHDDKGVMAALIVYGARLAKGPANSELPAYRPETGVAVCARTAIDKGRGVVDRHKLFHTQEVAPGAQFEFHMRFIAPPEQKLAESARRLLALLIHDLSNGDLRLGRGTADGAGRLAWQEKKARRAQLDAETGELRHKELPDGWRAFGLAQEEANKLGAQFGRSVTLVLKTDGPFFVNDWWWSSQAAERKRKAKRERGERATVEEPQLRALRTSPVRPELPGSSLSGELRARAEWLAQRERLRASHETRDPAFGQEEVDGLFGTTERKARLRLRSIEGPETTSTLRAASVKLDRLAHGPMDSALFDVEAFVGCQFTAVFELPHGLSRGEAALCEALWGDVEHDGVMLGHASSRGFGWFAGERSSAQ
jgi:CRISPR/Cas system CSM-associated protein Csm3 (group 7 of RAMP superfamily)